MHIPTLFWTALVAALLTALSLKFLKVFHFVKWSPLGWSKKWDILATESPIVKWFVLIIVLVLIFIVLYSILQVTSKIPPSITSIVLALLLVCAVEWTISRPDSIGSAFKSVSIPFLCLIAIITRFVVGTSVYMKNELPKKAK
ncbi:hypothetical protein DVB69_04380 [Sporosarcina sp. BI001-red]|uniref:hypothetical protein n=1 Tax=Sporosarcina sp. BI001-red TaxID=2282866 RepID=UPI000E24233C|nr:hypothetical protein [Sporosarcina sp. BI001-red]REB10048.1 hypothetical protein DVB69_04380 [Sporosarcina sp. BI001-red]